ncbi:hypothetical protein B0H19DRAFT_1080610 [Mycena capillaripes]|nr:hypothetical protein B0H19DRAFT_1080610 [Mycena capillaripes]
MASSSPPPPEIWRLIFWFATLSQNSSRHYIDYYIFQPIHATTTCEEQESLRLQTCISLMRVSRLFRAITAEFMYKDVRIFDLEDLKSFMAGIYRSAEEHGVASGYGSYVRRLEFPGRRVMFSPGARNLRMSTPGSPCHVDTVRLNELLWLCPRLEILVRPAQSLDAENMALWSSLVGKPSLQWLPNLVRLEWHDGELDSTCYGTSHRDRLREILVRAPNLRYLFLSSDGEDSPVDFWFPPSLHTIRIQRSDWRSSNSKSSKSWLRPHMPNFRNLVLHTPPSTVLVQFLASAGEQLRVLELAFAPQMTFSSNEMRRLLQGFPRLEELAYSLGAPEISPLINFQCRSIKRIHLKVDPEEWSPYRTVLCEQVEILEGPSFPELEEIILHDATRWWLQRDRGKELLRRLLGRGFVLRYEDGSPVTVPN